MSKYNTCLLGVPIFKNLKEEDLIKISDLIEPVDLVKNHDLYQAGDRLSDLFILHRGSLKVYNINENGKVQILRILKPGDFLGENGLFSETIANEYVAAMVSSHICRIPGAAIKELLKTSPQLSIEIIQVLAQRLDVLEGRVMLNSTLPTQQRIMKSLEQLSDDSGMVLLPSSKKDFAASLGMAQETLSRQLSMLQKDGVISMSGQRMIQIIE